MGEGRKGGEGSRRKEVLEPEVDGEVEVENSPSLGFSGGGGVDAEGRREVDRSSHPIFQFFLGETSCCWWW